MNNKKKIIAIVGPTASGKSALALALAKEYGGEIISCDSMQVYKRMNIGTAKPSALEMSEVRHHLIDVKEPTESFSCEDYVSLASSAIDLVSESGRLPIVCGGTGLYLDALLRGGNSAPSIDTSDIRAELSLRAKNEGIFALYEELLRVDPESAAAIHPNNVKRIIRALEIYIASGEKKSELDKRSKELESPYDATVIYLNYLNRDILYRRIDSRVDSMIKDGLVEETRALMAERVFELNRTASQAIGYKELFGFIEGRESLESAIETLKRATRRYAKRQVTWFSAKDYILPLDADSDNGLKTFEEIVNNAKKLFSV
ncbi:MAG: tRNA (adenosine(37)-N6)-dimethylallyltransferase MiaA [Clostridia bacterium]|nr:tRNA (adenosine(37)-N6)-dimethylallyltransferase MiaA [Clostridia bacterium]